MKLLDHVSERRESRFLVAGAGMAGFFFLLVYFLVSIGLAPFASSSLAYVSALGVQLVIPRSPLARKSASSISVAASGLCLDVGLKRAGRDSAVHHAAPPDVDVEHACHGAYQLHCFA